MDVLTAFERFALTGYGSGDGSGDGYGSGYGYGYGDGYGYGSGYGSGDGDGYGYGDGSGDGSGLKEISGERIFHIDGVPTILRQVHGDYARGAILGADLTEGPCYVVKGEGYFAHGPTLRAARAALTEKIMMNSPVEDRIKAFMECHELDGRYSTRDFFEWHHRLTGSCDAGRRAFLRDKGFDLGGSATVREFIAATEEAYGGDVIRELKEAYGL